jgi:SAM-dependent methyltransferase
VSGFSADWLALREPYDRAARNGAVLEALARPFADRESITVVDLGCGTGATLRAISARLPAQQDWRLLDHAEDLLARAGEGAVAFAPAITVVTEQVDLLARLEAAVGHPDLLAMSALLDLVSQAWLDRLVALAAERRLVLYAALSYDGRVVFDPPAADDETVIAAVNRHQLTDKGFGPALGPTAAGIAAKQLKAMGFDLITGASDWCFGPDDRAIQLALLDGFATAAVEIGIAAPLISEWLMARRAHLAAGQATLRVGHVDFVACPTARR